MDRAKTGALLTIALLLAGCGPRESVRVGAKNFTEQSILGEILAQHLEARLAAPVERRLDLGGTLLAHGAAASGEIDLYAEYTGTALTAVLDLPPHGPASEVLDTVRREYERRFGLTWRARLGFNNSFAIAIRGERARRLGLRTLSEAAQQTEGWRLGMGYEFEDRPDGLRGLLTAYELRLAGPPRTMDLGLLHQALADGAVDMIAASATDGLLVGRDAVVLEDDRAFFPPYEAAVVVRLEALERVAGLGEALAELEGTIDEEAMRRLNHRVDGDRVPAARAAREFLTRAGLARAASR